jgi:O-antigen/teichoic acid export membrane protein
MSPRVEISKRLVLLNSASGVLAKVINVSVQVWSIQYLLRRISDEEYALLPVLMGIILLMPLATSVLTAGLGRYVMVAYAKGDDRGVTQIVSTMFPILAAASLVLLVGGGLLAWHIDKVLDIPAGRLWDARGMMALLMFSVASKPVFSVFSVGIYVRQAYVRYNLMNVGNQLFRALLLFALLYGVSARVLWVVVANVVADKTLSIRIALFSRRMIPALRFKRREIQWRRARELLSFGGWNFLGALAYHLRQAVIPLILHKLATPLDVTVFHVGYLARHQIDQWTALLITPLHPVITGMHAIGAQERVRNVYTRGGRISLWAVLLLALPAIIYSKTIIYLYSARHADAAIVMSLSLACLALTAGTQMIWPLASATGRVRLTGASALISQLVVFACAAYVLKTLQWGAVGVVLTIFTVGLITSVAVIWPLGQRLAGITFGVFARQTLLPGLTPGCVASVVWVLLGIVWRPDSWGGLGACTLIGMIVYAGVLLTYCLEPLDRQDLARILTGIKSLRQGIAGQGAGGSAIRPVLNPGESMTAATDSDVQAISPPTGPTNRSVSRDEPLA